MNISRAGLELATRRRPRSEVVEIFLESRGIDVHMVDVMLARESGSCQCQTRPEQE
jgi:hypothetical protein